MLHVSFCSTSGRPGSYCVFNVSGPPRTMDPSSKNPLYRHPKWECQIKELLVVCMSHKLRYWKCWSHISLKRVCWYWKVASTLKALTRLPEQSPTYLTMKAVLHNLTKFKYWEKLNSLSEVVRKSNIISRPRRGQGLLYYLLNHWVTIFLSCVYGAVRLPIIK